MIGSIKGKIIFKTDRFVLVEASGVGYKVYTTTDILSKIKIDDEIFFYIHTHVREDILDLYGFQNYAEFELFAMLINVSGIGPKGAIAILGIAPIDTLKKAIVTSDLPYLTKISGIGKKTAEKMVIELRDKMGKIENQESLREELDALEALKTLGYSTQEAREALKGIAGDTNTKIRSALKILGGK